MTHHLKPPSESLSRMILRPVPYKDRFPAGRLKPPVGVIPGDVRSLPELHLYLEPDEASLPGIRLEALPAWIDKSIGDTDLAESIRTVVAAQKNYVDGCLKVHELLGQRLDQARSVMGESE